MAVRSLTDRFSQHGRVVAEKGLSEESFTCRFFTAVRAYVFNSAGAKVVARLRVLLFGRMLAQETAWFDARETGDLLSRLASDTQKIQAAATETVSLALRSAISALVSFALLFLTSWRLAGLATAVVPFLIGATFLAMRVVKRLAKESQAALARAGAVAQEGLANQRVVRSFGAEGFEVGRYAHAVGGPRRGRAAGEGLEPGARAAAGGRAGGVHHDDGGSGLRVGAGRLVLLEGVVVRGQMTTGVPRRVASTVWKSGRICHYRRWLARRRGQI